jgi:exosortase A
MSGQPAILSPPLRSVSWPMGIFAFVMGLMVLLAAFTTEVTAALDTWENSTAYNHCWLVLPVALWLAWGRRERLQGLQPSPAPLAAVGALLAGCAWLVAERLGIMEGRQLAVLAMVWSLVLAVFGWRFVRAMMGPLLYLVFLVPFGAFIVPVLQRFTAWFIVTGLQIFSIPHYHDELVIEIPAGTFLVAEACAGLRFFIAALAFGAVYALAMFRSPSRRLAVMALAIIVPVVANGVRALGIVLLGHTLGSAEAAAADHVLYGWVFFSLVILLLVVAGLPFREDAAPDTNFSALPRSPGRGATALMASAVLCCAFAAAAPALAAVLDRVSPAASVEPRLNLPPECAATGQGGAFRCGNAVLSARLLVFSPRVTWSKVSAERRGMANDDDEAVTFNISTGDVTWSVRQDAKSGAMVAVASWLSGRPAGDGLRSRLAQALNSLHEGSGRPVVAAIIVRFEDHERDAASQQRARAWLRGVMQGSTAEFVDQAAALSR